MKTALVIRHKLLPSQEKAIKLANLEIVETIQQIPEKPQEFQEFVKRLKAKGVEAILTVALPPHLLAQLSKHFKILIFKMEAIKLVESEVEAKKIINEKPELRVALPSAVGEKKTFRILEFRGIYEVKVIIEEKPLVTI